MKDLQVCSGFFKILIIYTSFQPELSKCCHEVMIGNIGDRVMLHKKLVKSNKKKKKKIIHLAVTCNAISKQY